MSPAPVGLLGEPRERNDNGEVVSLVAPDVDDLLAEGEDPYDWVLPDIIESSDRVIVTGGEGEGKSTLLRQIAMTSASGLHPFTLDDIEPVKVLYVELENGRRHTKRELRKLRAAAGDRYVRGRLRVRIAPGGMDLTRSSDADSLLELIDVNRPRLLVCGPIYKMAGGDPNDEQTARSVVQALDRVRAEFNLAILLEAHSPHGSNGGSRPLRPYGASLWQRWPEFGLHIARDGKLTHWRGPRDERSWPTRLQRGSEWPWIAASSSETPDDDWKPTALMERVSARLIVINASGEQPTRNALATSTTGKRAFVFNAIDTLIADGFIASDGKHLKSLKSYPTDVTI